MQCQRCHFENMPGEQRCFKCGSVLAGQAGVLDVHPPRMAPWKRPWRSASRVWRRHSPLGDLDASGLPTQWATENSDIIWGIILSIVPGFAQLVTGRFRRILWAWVLWWLLMGVNAVFFKTPWGWSLLGVAAAVHAWIALDAGLREHLSQALERVAALMATFVSFLVVYIVLAEICLPTIGFERIPMAIPGAKVRSGDTLLLRDLTADAHPLARGTLVAFRARTLGRLGTRSAIGQVVGLPDDLVVIDQHAYTVNGAVLPRDKFPTPRWFPAQRIEVRVGPTQYFISSEYTRTRGRRGVGSDIIKRLCLVKKEAIESRATMVWWPLPRRHHLNVSD